MQLNIAKSTRNFSKILKTSKTDGKSELPTKVTMATQEEPIIPERTSTNVNLSLLSILRRMVGTDEAWLVPTWWQMYRLSPKVIYHYRVYIQPYLISLSIHLPSTEKERDKRPKCTWKISRDDSAWMKRFYCFPSQ